MKKILTVIIAAALVLSALAFAGCSGKGNNPGEDTLTNEDGSADDAVTDAAEAEKPGSDETSDSASGDASAEVTDAEGQPVTGEAPSSSETAAPVGPTVASLAPEKTSGKPGEVVRVYFRLSPCPLFAYAKLNYTVSDNAVFTGSNSTGDVSGLYAMDTQPDERSVQSGIMVATTADVTDKNISYVDVRIANDAASGDEVVVNLLVGEVGIGTDESGSEVDKLDVDDASCVITVE